MTTDRRSTDVRRIDSGGALSLCVGCRAQGWSSCRLGIESEAIDSVGVASFVVACPADAEGGPCTAHGGWIAGVLTELCGRCMTLSGETGVIASLSVEYARPVPIGAPLRGRAWLVDRTPGAWELAAELALGTTGKISARGSSIFALRDLNDHYSRFSAWREEHSE
jgi:hypothetical protein